MPCPPIFFAVAFGRNATLVDFLITRGAKATAAPGGGLFAAGWWGDVEILDLLLRAGSPIDVVVGVTPFLACWCWKRFDAAKFLATNGANVNYQAAHVAGRARRSARRCRSRRRVGKAESVTEARQAIRRSAGLCYLPLIQFRRHSW